MMRAALDRSMALLVLALALGVLGVHIVRALRRGGLADRPVLFAGSLLGSLPLLYVLLAWVGVYEDRYLRLARPLLSLPMALALGWLSWRLRILPARWTRERRLLTEILLLLGAGAAALAVIGTEGGRPLDRLAVMVAIDRSRSMDLVPDAEARARAELAVAELGMGDDDLIGVLAFASEALVEEPFRPRSGLPVAQRVELGRDGTDLAEAIRRALNEVPADCATRIVLLTDGVSTRGVPEDAAVAAAATGVPIDVVPLDQAKVPNLRLVGLRMPARAAEHEPLELRLVVQASAAGEIQVRVLRDGELLEQASARVKRGEDILSLREIAPEPGLHRYDVELSALDPRQDQFGEDNRGTTFLRVQGQTVALVMESDPKLATPLVQALEGAAFHVVSVGSSGIPAHLSELAVYDLVVLSDIRSSDLATEQLGALASYVRDLGGGLLLMGGDRSLGPGGYGQTPVEEVSPVAFDIKQERRRSSLAQLIAIDYSGSMGEKVARTSKLGLANEAAVRSAELLGEGDRLGVIHVDTEVRWTVPTAPVVDRGLIAQKVRSVGPGGGGIDVSLALSAAYRALLKEKVNLKHVLLFADGNDAEQMEKAPGLVRGARGQGITTSVVALGRGSDIPGLEDLSRLGDGRFYLIEDAARLPAVFAQETILAARSAINEVTFRPSPGPAAAPPTRGIDFAAAPALDGYVVTIPKSRAQVLLAGPEGDPLLATWSVGIGRVGVFTSDYKDRWGRAWTYWPEAGRLFGQLGRDLGRAEADTRVRMEADAAGGELHVRATVVDDDGRTESFRRLTVRIAGPDGSVRELPLTAVGAGAYQATLALSRPGAFMVTAMDELTRKPVGVTGAVLHAGEELRPSGTDRALLSRIAQLSGGKMRDTLAGIFRDRSLKRFAYQDFSGSLLVLAAFCLLGSVAARRLVLPQPMLRGFPLVLWRRAAGDRQPDTGVARDRAAAGTVDLPSEPPPDRVDEAAPRAAEGPVADGPAAVGRAAVARAAVARAAVARAAVARAAVARAAVARAAVDGGAVGPGEDRPVRRPPSAVEILLARRKRRQ